MELFPQKTVILCYTSLYKTLKINLRLLYKKRMKEGDKEEREKEQK